jgi:hypothetical protein
VFSVNIASKAVKAVCFDTLLQVLLLKDMERPRKFAWACRTEAVDEGLMREAAKFVPNSGEEGRMVYVGEGGTSIGENPSKLGENMWKDSA